MKYPHIVATSVSVSLGEEFTKFLIFFAGLFVLFYFYLDYPSFWQRVILKYIVRDY